MKISRLLRAPFATIAASAALLSAAAGQEAASTPLPEAREIIERFATVTKQSEAIEKTSSTHIKGKFKMAAMGLEGTVEAWGAKPCRYVSSIDMGAYGKAVTGNDGQVAWSSHAMLGTRVLRDAELLQAKLEARYDAVLKPADDYESLRTVGRENFEGKDCYKIEAVARPLPGMDPEKTREVRTSHEFYEVESGLLMGSKGRQESELGGGPYTKVVSDYKEFGVQLLATRTQLRQSSQEIEFSIESVEYDTATDATFALPQDVRKMLEPKVVPKPQ